MTLNLKITKIQNLSRRCWRILGWRKFSLMFRKTLSQILMGKHHGWYYWFCFTFLFHIRDDSEKNEKIFRILFLDKEREKSSSKEKKVKWWVISSIETHNHSPCIHLSRMKSALKLFKIYKILFLFSQPQGKFGENLWMVRSLEIIIRQSSELDHWSNNIFLFHTIYDLEKPKFLSFSLETKPITHRFQRELSKLRSSKHRV